MHKHQSHCWITFLCCVFLYFILFCGQREQWSKINRFNQSQQLTSRSRKSRQLGSSLCSSRKCYIRGKELHYRVQGCYRRISGWSHSRLLVLCSYCCWLWNWRDCSWISSRGCSRTCSRSRKCICYSLIGWSNRSICWWSSGRNCCWWISSSAYCILY